MGTVEVPICFYFCYLQGFYFCHPCSLFSCSVNAQTVSFFTDYLLGFAKTQIYEQCCNICQNAATLPHTSCPHCKQSNVLFFTLKYKNMRFLSANAFQLFFIILYFFPTSQAVGDHTQRGTDRNSPRLPIHCYSWCLTVKQVILLPLSLSCFIIIFQRFLPFSASFLHLPLFCPLMCAILL